MSLLDTIHINSNYTRSINIERDAGAVSVIKNYIPTSRALQTLSRIEESFCTENILRSWALVGPYGSGKSAFAVFLSHLLGHKNNPTTQKALEILCDADAELSIKFYNEIKASKGFLNVLLTGTPESLSKRFIKILHEAAENYWQNKSGRTPAIVGKLHSASNKGKVSINEIMELLSELQRAVFKSKGKGILIVFDELGKFLEYEARHYGANDIYLLQALAEHAYSGRDANLYIVVLMHQGFEQYARGLGENLRNEWAKVQGRYENIPFLESSEQILRIVGKAIEHDFTDKQKNALKKKCLAMAKVLADQKALPHAMAEEEAADLFVNCYPLHPVAGLALPVLCQKVAQNERTLFSYLGSKEPHGFKDSIRALEIVGDFINPWEIYDYFIVNQPAVLHDPLTHRRWAEVVTAIERLGDAPPEEIQLLKTIGLLNIIGVQGGLKASKDIIKLCPPSAARTSKTADALTDKSILQYRKYSGEYRVWQGSDFDLEAAVQEELSQVGRFDLPSRLNERKPLPPVVARRHTIKKGSLRYFQPHFVDTLSFSKEQRSTKNLRFILCLAETEADIKLFKEHVVHRFDKLDVVALCQNGAQLREAVSEVLALKRVQRNRPELHSDPVALREFKDRLIVAEQIEDQLVSAFFEQPQEGFWYWQGSPLQVTNKRNLQQELSRILDDVYLAAPIFKNELINRDRPSSQAITARNKLVAALLNHADKEDLGIDKFPAEKGVYRALFKATGLHRVVDGSWQLAAPDPENDPYTLMPVWGVLYKFLEDTEKKPGSFVELDEALTSPPYGVKEGILPILYVTAYLCYQHELAFYENGEYTPYITEQHIERFLKRPDFFAVQRFRISGMRASLFEEYVKALYKDTNREQTLHSIARPLAKFVADLPEYTKNTKRISEPARQVIRAIDKAKSPAEMLFVKLPLACGYPEIDPKATDKKKLEGFSVRLIEILRELSLAYPDLLKEQQDQISQALLNKKGLETGELRNLLSRYQGLDKFTIDKDGLRAFIRYICNRSHDDETWLEALLMFLGRRPSKKWTDTNREGVDLRLTEYSRRLNDLRRLQFAYEDKLTKKIKDFDIILLRAMRHGKTENDEVVYIDSSHKKYIAETKEKMVGLLADLEGKEAKLALLAELVDDFLVEAKQDSKSTKKVSLKKIGNE
jgi:hypothetical protein